MLAANGGGAVRFTQAANRATPVEIATNLTPPLAWQFLNVPENRPLHPASANAVTISDGATNAAQKFYRVRVTAP